MDNSTNEDGFVVEYSTASDFSSDLHALAAGVDTGSKWITGLSPGTSSDKTWYIRIRARNVDGDSSNTSAITAVTPGTTAHSTITVAAYTRTAIINAINSSNDGDTIFFPAGTYNISSRISQSDLASGKKLGGGRIYLGETTVVPSSDGAADVDDQTILHCTSAASESSDRVFFNLNSDDCDQIKFANLTFQGAGIFADTVTVDGLRITECHFDVTVHSGNQNVGIEWTTELRDSAVINSVFAAPDSFSIFGYDWDHLTIGNNKFTGIAGMHIDAHSASSSLLVEQNHLGQPGSPIRNQAVELQGSGSYTVIQDNYYENDGTLGYGNDSYAFSIPLDGGSNNISRRNYLDMEYYTDADGIGVRYIFELGGQNLDNYDNYSYGGNTVEVTDGGATGVIHDNHYEALRQAIGYPGGVSASNNGAGVDVTWDVNRPIPGPNQRVYGLAIGSGLLTVHGTKLKDTVAVETTTIDSTDFYVLTLNGEPFVFPAADLDAVQFVESKHLASLTVGDDTVLIVAEHATPNDHDGTIVVDSLSISTDGLLDLTNNSMIIDYSGSVGSLLDDVRSYLANGQMITTATTPSGTKIGYADNALLGFSTFAGQTVDSSSVLIKFTYGADATLDGKVDIADLRQYADHFNPNHTGSPTAVWYEGDFTYDGWVDQTDLAVLAANWQAGVGNPLSLVGGGESESEEDEFVNILEKLGFSETEIESLLEILGSNSGGSAL
jgi:hypothetical protein